MATSTPHPGTSLRAAVVFADAMGSALVAGAAILLGPILQTSPWHILKSTAVFSIVMLIVLARIDRFHPFARLGPANQVTAIRAVLVALAAGLVGEPAAPRAGVFVAAASGVVTLLDGVDGWLARRSGLASRFGARFDMEVDALLILALSLLAWQFGKAGAWIVLAGLMRYLFVAASLAVPRLAAPLPPSRRRQTVCVLQVLGLSAIVLPVLRPPVTVWLAGVLILMLAWSFAVDIAWLWRQRA